MIKITFTLLESYEETKRGKYCELQYQGMFVIIGKMWSWKTQIPLNILKSIPYKISISESFLSKYFIFSQKYPISLEYLDNLPKYPFRA